MKGAATARGRMEGEIKTMEKEVGDIERRRDKELAKGGKVQVLEGQQKELARECTKLEAQVDITEGNLREEEMRIAELEGSAKEARPALSLLPGSN